MRRNCATVRSITIPSGSPKWKVLVRSRPTSFQLAATSSLSAPNVSVAKVSFPLHRQGDLRNPRDVDICKDLYVNSMPKELVDCVDTVTMQMKVVVRQSKSPLCGLEVDLLFSLHPLGISSHSQNPQVRRPTESTACLSSASP